MTQQFLKYCADFQNVTRKCFHNYSCFHGSSRTFSIGKQKEKKRKEGKQGEKWWNVFKKTEMANSLKNVLKKNELKRKNEVKQNEEKRIEETWWITYWRKQDGQLISESSCKESNQPSTKNWFINVRLKKCKYKNDNRQMGQKMGKPQIW